MGPETRPLTPKIAIIGEFWEASLESSYLRAFETLGCGVKPIDVTSYMAPLLPSSHILRRFLRSSAALKASKRIVDHVRTFAPSLVLVLKGKWIPPSAIELMTRCCEHVCNFNPDSPWEHSNSSRWIRSSLPLYSHHFTWSRRLLPKFISNGARVASYLPFAYDPYLHLHSLQPSHEFKSVFVGTYDKHRDELLASLGSDVAIWGNGWHQARRVSTDAVKGTAVYGRDAVALMARGNININILRPQNVGSHNMRTYEIPATGSCMLTTRSEEQSELLREGHEMLCYTGPEELKERVDWAASHPGIVKDIGLAAKARLSGETYTARAQQILNILGLGR